MRNHSSKRLLIREECVVDKGAELSVSCGRSSGTNMIHFLPDFGLTEEAIDPFGNYQFLSVAQSTDLTHQMVPFAFMHVSVSILFVGL